MLAVLFLASFNQREAVRRQSLERGVVVTVQQSQEVYEEADSPEDEACSESFA
jgi:hypothetical protein